MLLKQDFWSILLQTTYLAVGGRTRLRARRQRVRAMPVAMGTRKQSRQDLNRKTRFTTINFGQN